MYRLYDEGEVATDPEAYNWLVPWGLVTAYSNAFLATSFSLAFDIGWRSRKTSMLFVRNSCSERQNPWALKNSTTSTVYYHKLAKPNSLHSVQFVYRRAHSPNTRAPPPASIAQLHPPGFEAIINFMYEISPIYIQKLKKCLEVYHLHVLKWSISNRMVNYCIGGEGGRTKLYTA